MIRAEIAGSAGLRAAAAIAETLRAAIPAHAEVELYSSDLRRTAQTADVIGELLRVPPVLDPGLREKSYGEAEGKPQDWLRERFVTPPAVGERLGHHDGIPGSETMAAFGDRVYAAMATIMGSDCAHQIVVTHGGTLTFAIASWTNLPIAALAYARFHGAPGSITELREDDYFHNRQVIKLGDTTHLAAGSGPACAVEDHVRGGR